MRVDVQSPSPLSQILLALLSSPITLVVDKMFNISLFNLDSFLFHWSSLDEIIFNLDVQKYFICKYVLHYESAIERENLFCFGVLMKL